MKKTLVYFLIAIICLVPAALLRHTALLNLLEEDISVIPSVLEFTLVKNSGAAFGILAGNTKLLAVFTIIIILAIAVYVVVCRDKIRWLELVSLALICGGGVFNLYERLAYGYVIDYINIQILPVFNFADMCVTSGCILLIIAVLFEPKKQTNE